MLAVSRAELEGFSDHPVAQTECHIGSKILMDALLATPVGTGVTDVVMNQ